MFDNENEIHDIANTILGQSSGDQSENESRE